MKKEIIIAGGLGLLAGLAIMHFAMKNKEKKSSADGDFTTDRSKKVWDNMLDVTGTPIDPKGGMVTGRVSNMLDADASEVSNMLDVEGYSNMRFPKSQISNMLDASGIRNLNYPSPGKLYYHRQQAVQNANVKGQRNWPGIVNGRKLGWS